MTRPGPPASEHGRSAVGAEAASHDVQHRGIARRPDRRSYRLRPDTLAVMESPGLNPSRIVDLGELKLGSCVHCDAVDRIEQRVEVERLRLRR